MEAEQEQHESQNSLNMEAEQEPHEPQNNQRAREISYKKRNPTVMRKANELSQLCNISVCVISYGPDGNVNTWPESREDVVGILNNYKNHSGIHKKWPFSIRENNNNKEGEGEGVEDVDEESKEHEERNKVEEFGNELKKWKNWLHEENEEASLKRGFNMLKSNLCAMKNRLKLLQNRKRKRSNDNNNNNTTDTPNNDSNSFEVGSSSSCTSTTRARIVHDFDLNEEICVDYSGNNDEHQNVGSMDVSTPLEIEPISMWPMTP